MQKKFTHPLPCFYAFFSIATLIFATQGLCEQGSGTTLGQLIKTIAQSQPENSFIPIHSEPISSDKVFSHIKRNMLNEDIHVLDGKNLETLLSNLDFLNIVHAFSGGATGESLISKKLYLKENGFINSTDIGLATEVKGEITQFHKGSAYGKVVSLATPLFQFDQIKTARKSRATFTLDDESRVIISGASNISIDKNIYEQKKRFRQMLFRLSKGTAHFVVSKSMKKGSTFAVVTPNGIAGVRGTEFVTMVEPGGKTRFVVLEGKIETAPRLPGGKLGERFFIRAGEMQTLYKSGRASRIQKAPKRLLDHLQKNSLIQQKKEHPKPLRKTDKKFNKSKHSSRSRMTKTKTLQENNFLKQNELFDVLGKGGSTRNQGIDRESLRAFNKLSQPSKLDRFKPQLQNQLKATALDKFKQQNSMQR